jgi:hypothetical protein
MEGHKESYFDTETVQALLQRLDSAVPDASNEQHGADRWQAIALSWEGAPPTTRNAVEAELRRSGIPLDAGEFLNTLITLLRASAPPRIAKVSVTRELSIRIAEVWGSLGLKVGAAYDGMYGKNIKSSFEQFCAAALRAVGVDARISRRQIKWLIKDAKEKERRARTNQPEGVASPG